MTDYSDRPPVYRLSTYDKLTISRIEYRFVERTETGYILRRVDEPDITESFSVAALHAIWQQQSFRYYPQFFNIGTIRAKGEDADALLRDLSEDQQKATIFKADLCDLWLRESARNREQRSACKRGATKPVRFSLTDEFLKTWLPDAATAICRQMRANKRAGNSSVQIDEPSARTFRNWLKRYRDGGFLAYALRPYPGKKPGNPQRKAQRQALEIMVKHATQFASPTRPNVNKLWTDMRAEIDALNLAAPDDPTIKPVCKKTFQSYVKSLPAFDVFARREGLEKALRHFGSNREGLFAAYIGEYGQQDDTRIKLMQFLKSAGLLNELTPKMIAALESKRYWLGLTIDVASRCIVAARITETVTSDHAIAGLRLMLSDKTDLAASYGCTSPWHHRTSFRTLSTDQGSNYVAGPFKAAVKDFHINSLTLPAGAPKAHASIERFNKTLQNQALMYLDGRTFSNPVDRGDYNSEQAATLALEEVETVIIRYIVDIYHNTPHIGLGGETPANAWRRLSQEGLMRPPPDATMRRRALGIERHASLHPGGITFLGVWYSTPSFDPYTLKNGFQKVKVKLDPHDIGTVSVALEGEWIDAPAKNPIFRGATLFEWEATLTDLNRRYETDRQITAPIVHAAINDIKRIRDVARVRAAFESEDITKMRIAGIEAQMLNRPAIGDYDSVVTAPDLFGSLSQISPKNPDEQNHSTVDAVSSANDDSDGWRY